MPQPVFEVDLEGNVTYSNLCGFETFGYTHKDIERGINALQLFIPEDRERARQNIQKRLAGEEFSDHEYTCLRKDNSTFPVIVYSSAIIRNKIPVGLRGIVLDITERKLAEEKQRRAQKELELMIHERTAELQKVNEALLSYISEKEKIEDALRESEQKYHTLFEESKDVVYMSTPDGKFIDINPSGVELFGYSSKEEIFKINISNDLYTNPADREIFQKALEKEGYVKDYEVVFKRKDGKNITVLLTANTVQDDKGNIIAYRGIMKDITERKHLEHQLLQAQKMEAIGQLAGGIAHDFNNILTAIIGYGILLKTEVSHNKLLSDYISNILTSAEKAANLTHNLLAFSRKQMINLRPVNLNNTINVMKTFLLRLIGEDIELSVALTDKDLTVMADNTQIEQVLLNLATNARDAMPDGGHLTVRTEHVEIGNDFIRTHGYGKIGSYAFISVEDTGQGMDNETKGRLFDPFFTTKEVGKGTGLGLSMVYGIIKQHNGYIDVQTEIGRGTTFKIYLPLFQSPVENKKTKDFPILMQGTETILVAEDDTYVRDFLNKILTDYGYKVIEAIDGEDAIRLLHSNLDKINLSILDVIMPKKDGKEVYQEIKKVKPDIKVIFTSGYAKDIIYKKGAVDEELNFISKPISTDELLLKVREILDK